MPTWSDDTAVSIRGLGKAYRIARNAPQHSTLAEALVHCVRHPFRRKEHDTFWALQDVSAEIRKGEVVGIVGQNGAGKSTLLKILSRITEPTAGEVDLYGRVGSLLEVGTGFHRELTGRENIYLNGAILGMTRREVRQRFDEIVDFSGVERFLDTPIKRYSSGMTVRLAFAVAAHLEPEVLIVDEVLAVGDAEFQRKCLGKMRDVAAHGRTVLFVSHNMAALEGLCSRGILLEAGAICMDGPIASVTDVYVKRLTAAHTGSCYRRTCSGAENSVPHIESASVIGPDRTPASCVKLGSELYIRVDLSSQRMLHSPRVGVGIDNLLGQRFLSINSSAHGQSLRPFCGRSVVECRIPMFPLGPGTYNVKLVLCEGSVCLDTVDNALQFSVVNADAVSDGRGFHAGICITASEWSHTLTSAARASRKLLETGQPHRPATPKLHEGAAK